MTPAPWSVVPGLNNSHQTVLLMGPNDLAIAVFTGPEAMANATAAASVHECIQQLKELEFTEGSWPGCPVCGFDPQEGHTNYCKFNKLKGL